MTTPAEVKMALELKAMMLAVTITGVHSVCLIDHDTVDAIFDIKPDESGCGLHFQFPLPQMGSRNDLRAFGEWLASSDYGGTLH
jgi:hypothetical protein